MQVGLGLVLAVVLGHCTGRAIHPSHIETSHSAHHHNISFMEAIDLLEIARMNSKGQGQVRDLEQEVTNYESLLLDGIFEIVQGASAPGPSLSAFLAYDDPFVTQTEFEETPVTKEQVKRFDYACLPPLRAFAEAVETFYIYSGGNDKIIPQNIRDAYKNSYDVELSLPHAVAMIRGLKYNPATELDDPEISKCEFVKGYLESRKFIELRHVADVEPTFSARKPWGLARVTSKMRAAMPEEWHKTIDTIFRLDRTDMNEAMTKCEVALFLASCRLHHETHFLSFVPGPADSSAHSWSTFQGHYLFPHDSAEVQNQESAVMMLEETLFVTHDLEGVGVLSRDEFTRMLKTMDMWQDSFVYGSPSKKKAKILESTPDNLVVDVQTLKRTALPEIVKNPDFTKRLAEIWRRTSNHTKEMIMETKVAKMLEATGNVKVEDAATEATKIVKSYAPSLMTASDGLKRNDFMGALLNPPDFCPYVTVADLEILGGLVAGYHLKDAEAETRQQYRGLAISRQLDRTMFAILVPILNIFLSLKDPNSKDYSGLTFEEFQRLPEFLPKVAGASEFSSASSKPKRELFKKYAQSDVMKLPDFAMLFAEDSRRIKAGMAPFITLSSFSRMSRLNIPMTTFRLAEADELEQKRYQAKLKQSVKED